MRCVAKMTSASISKSTSTASDALPSPCPSTSPPLNTKNNNDNTFSPFPHLPQPPPLSFPYEYSSTSTSSSSSSSNVSLVSYESHHVPLYVQWMKDPILRKETKSEGENFTFEEETKHQKSIQNTWENILKGEDKDKGNVIREILNLGQQNMITFLIRNAEGIICGDVNVIFHSQLREVDEHKYHSVPLPLPLHCELLVMIPSPPHRRLGLSFLSVPMIMKFCFHFFQISHFIVKIDAQNVKSLNLFKKLQFVQTEFCEEFQEITMEYNIGTAAVVVSSSSII